MAAAGSVPGPGVSAGPGPAAAANATPAEEGAQGRGSLVGCCLWGHTESDTTEVT